MRLWISPRHIGHCATFSEHSIQAHKRLNGIKTTFLTLTKHIEHSFGRWLAATFSRRVSTCPSSSSVIRWWCRAKLRQAAASALAMTSSRRIRSAWTIATYPVILDIFCLNNNNDKKNKLNWIFETLKFFNCLPNKYHNEISWFSICFEKFSVHFCYSILRNTIEWGVTPCD